MALPVVTVARKGRESTIDSAYRELETMKRRQGNKSDGSLPTSADQAIVQSGEIEATTKGSRPEMSDSLTCLAVRATDLCTCQHNMVTQLASFCNEGGAV